MRLVLPQETSAADQGKNPSRWLALPGLCCQAAGGDLDTTKEITAAWALLYTAAHLMDSVEDGDLGDEVRALGGSGVAINVANGLFLSAALALNSLHEKDQTKTLATQINADFFDTILVMTSGQHRDLVNPRITLEQWWQIAEAKSGSFFSLACRSGAQLAVDDPVKIKGYSDYGFHLGIMLQILDDFEDLQTFVESDEFITPNILQRSLAAAYAGDVLQESDKQKLDQWLGSASQNSNRGIELIKMLDSCGAGFYMVAELEKHFLMGMAALNMAKPLSIAGEQLANFIQELKLE